MLEGYVQISLHNHCKTCIRSDCKVLSDDVNCCDIINCKYGCPLKFHKCKELQHEKFCKNMKVPCLNREYGCCQEFPRGKLPQHLPNCNASVISFNNQDIKRADYFWYAKNVVEDLGGKDLHNYSDSCPFSFAGCDFSYEHFKPNGNRRIVYSDWLDAVGLQNIDNQVQPSGTNAQILDTKGQRSQQGLPNVTVDTDELCNRLESSGISDQDFMTSKRKNVKNFSHQSSLALIRSISQDDQKQYAGLLLLPLELLQKIASYLDGFSLCNLSVTCHFLRDICSLMLVDKGIVTPVWTKFIGGTGQRDVIGGSDDRKLDTTWTMADGSVKDKKWIVKQMSWRFCKTFDPVRQWEYQGAHPLLIHLQNCPFKTESCLNANKEPFTYHKNDNPKPKVVGAKTQDYTKTTSHLL
ncbi:F-box only protein 40-like [Ylistrum balloti]|uniref:F-box only protein 40-like n=1 Tax=Ylistrum balloti TaxID=509963 RepID=UPI002905DD3D|nr:F-box only protein 40-like [Ylistrum balloti]